MTPTWLFDVFVVIGLAGAWATFLYCIWVTVTEFRSGQLLKTRDTKPDAE